MKASAQDIWIDRAGMGAIVIVSLGYVLFGSSFAQLRLEFSFLDFPIFIGEILLVFTSLLLIVKSVRQKWALGHWGWMLGAALFFVLFKAVSGYLTWGPLALRDAALFYYPFFAVLGYSFWSNDLGGDKTRRWSLAVVLCIFILYQFVAYWPCSLIIIGVILALHAKSFWERIAFLGGIILFAPYETLCNVFLRTIFLSSLITVIFIGVVFFCLFCKDRWIRIAGVVIGGLVLGVVFFKIGQTSIWSTCDIRDVKPLALALPQEPSRGKCLFHPVGNSPDKPDTIKEFWKRMNKGSLFMKENCVSEEKAAFEESDSTLRIKKDDTRFRYYIWRDMAHEYIRSKPLFGFDFGRPLRSITMDHYGISSTEDTDGWIGAHNSFFYMIYRAGIVGLAVILSVIVLWFGLLHDFYILGDWTGLLFCAVLLFWIVAANFFLIFEMPYTAIPVWTILGITLKHRALLKKAGV